MYTRDRPKEERQKSWKLNRYWNHHTQKAKQNPWSDANQADYVLKKKKKTFSKEYNRTHDLPTERSQNLRPIQNYLTNKNQANVMK